ncbi:fumarate reductase subunit FrdD [Orbus wheelerorum]|uniref:fumarate reductase subunit FrdD n=1 Tax=Orbus wheelerorum TaxID=3074111 RepID=UPI00370D070F
MENKQKQLKRSNERLFLGLFNVGGMWAAIFAPAIIIITAFIIPFGDAATRSYILKLMTMFTGKLFLFFMISLPIWYGLHRILHMLHDFNIHPRRGKLLTYGLALAWTIHTAYILFVR